MYLFIDSQSKGREIEEMTQLFEIEKEEMENEYSGFAVQYDEMKVHISNDSLIRQLDREKQRTQQLLEELRQTKASNARRIAELKKELATVRTVMKDYVRQIDSLNATNARLTEENQIVRRENQQVKEQNSQLSTLNTRLHAGDHRL